MFKNLRREDIMKHPWIRVQDEDGSKPSFYTLAPTEEAFMSLLPASWVAILGTPKVEFFWVIKLKFGSGWARKRPVNPHVFSCEVCETGGFIETDERTILHVAAEKNFGKAMMEARECWVEWQGRIAFHSLVQNSWSCHIKAWPTKLAFKHSLSIHWSRHWNQFQYLTREKLEYYDLRKRIKTSSVTLINRPKLTLPLISDPGEECESKESKVEEWNHPRCECALPWHAHDWCKEECIWHGPSRG